MPENTSNIRVGDTLTVIDHPTYGVIPDGKIGDQHRVTEVVNDVHVETEPLGDADPVGTTASVLWFDHTPARPLIDFSGSSRTTARIYAKNHVSKVNKPETNKLLRAVAAGEKVDAYALNEALLDAMRGATTRAGQSMTRRLQGREIAYLGHIVHAVLASHADNLPAYAEGDRSRAVETAREGIREAQAEVERLTAALKAEKVKNLERSAEVLTLRDERSTLTQAASDERRRLVAEIEDLKAERDTLATVLGYALDRVSDRVAQRVLGFWDGLK